MLLTVLRNILSECFWLFAGGYSAACGLLLPLLPSLPLRALNRVLGRTREPLWSVAREVPWQLVLAVPVGMALSGLSNALLLWRGWAMLSRLLCTCLVNVLLFTATALFSIWRLRAPTNAAALGRATVVHNIHWTEVDGHEVMLRVFVPEGGAHAQKKRPAVVMVCGLLWLGEGLLGRIGLTFNDAFGRAFARFGAPCVQVHTPSRHIAYTRLPELVTLVSMTLAWPLLLTPGLRYLLLLLFTLLVATSARDLWLVLLAGLLPEVLDLVLAALAVPALLLWPPGAWLLAVSGLVVLPTLHAATRLAQFALCELPGPPCRNHQKEAAAAVAWARAHRKELGSDDRLVLCGYSSGGHVAALLALDELGKEAGAGGSNLPFCDVVLISGIYDLRTAWGGVRALLAPLFNVIFADILGLRDAASREAASPAAVASGYKSLWGSRWHVLNSRSELLGLQPLQNILFEAGPLCEALEAKGAEVQRYVCGSNHWLLLFSIEDFIGPFVNGLVGT